MGAIVAAIPGRPLVPSYLVGAPPAAAPVPVAGESTASIAMGRLRLALASSSRMRAWLGVSTTGAALGRIHRGKVPPTATRPWVNLLLDAEGFIRASREGVGVWLHEGSTIVAFEFAPAGSLPNPEGWPTDQERMMDATGVMEEVVLTAESAAGISITRWGVEDTGIVETELDEPTLMVDIRVDWGL